MTKKWEIKRKERVKNIERKIQKPTFCWSRRPLGSLQSPGTGSLTDTSARTLTLLLDFSLASFRLLLFLFLLLVHNFRSAWSSWSFSWRIWQIVGWTGIRFPANSLSTANTLNSLCFTSTGSTSHWGWFWWGSGWFMAIYLGFFVQTRSSWWGLGRLICRIRLGNTLDWRLRWSCKLRRKIV